MLTEMLDRTRLEHAAGSVMWCSCGRLLDCRTTVVVDRGDEVRVRCAACFDEEPEEAADERQLTLPGVEPPPPAEILDGRKVRWPSESRPPEGLPGMTAWTDPVTGDVEHFETPSEALLEAWFTDTLCSALDGCEDIEHDSACRHGYPSWMHALGIA